MTKTLIALGLALLAVILIAACAESTGAPVYVEPAMESTTTTAATSESFTETTSQDMESETAVQAEAAASFSSGITTQALATSTTRAATSKEATAKATTTKAATTARPATQAPVTAAPYTPPVTAAATTTTTTAEPKPQTQAPVPQPVLENEAMGPEFLAVALNALNEIRAEFGLAPMREDPALMESSLELAWRMAKAEDCFHSENPHGCESVAYYPSQFFPAKVVGERLTYHSPGFREEQNVRVGIAVVKYDGYLYCVMQGDC